jgi:hypothetical protein
VLLGSLRASEDAFYDTMRLVHWPTATLRRTVALPGEALPYVEAEWARGMLPGTNVWCVANNNVKRGTNGGLTLHFCRPA